MRLLLLLAGVCRALQPGFKYTYQYQGRVTVGLPEINAKAGSVADLTATLVVWTPEEGEARMQLRDVEMSSADGGMCDQGDLDVEVTGEPMVLYPSIGDNTFAFSGGEFRFRDGENQGSINFFKSVALMFGLLPIRQTFFARSPFNASVLTGASEDREQTVLGDCRTTYTGVPLVGGAAAAYDRRPPLHADCQRREHTPQKTSKTGRKTTGRKVPGRKYPSSKTPGRKTPSKTSPQAATCEQIHPQVHRLTRTTNLDDCANPPFFQDIADKCPPGEPAQCHNAYSRSSHAVYHLRGSGDSGLRIESAEVTGAHTLSPLGRASERVKSLSLSRLVLQAVEPLDLNDVPRMDFPTIAATSLHANLPIFEKLSSKTFDLPPQLATPGELMVNIEGVHTDQDGREKFIEHAVEVFRGMKEVLAGGDTYDHRRVPGGLFYAKYLMYDFIEEEFGRVLEALGASHSHLLFDVVATIGSPRAVSFLLGKFHLMSLARQTLLLGSLRASVTEAIGVGLLVRHWLDAPLEEAPFVLAQLGVNTAGLLRERCAPWWTEGLCGELVAELRGALLEGLQSTDEFWKQMLFVKMLVNLRDGEATNALLPYVLGAASRDVTVRCLAMDALASYHAADPGQRTKYVLVLLELLENPAEAREVRARALGYLVSWRLSAAEWSRLALFTRRRDGSDLAAFAYSLIKATAEYESPDAVQQSQFAQHALLLVRPAPPARRRSAFEGWRKYGFRSQLDVLQEQKVVIDPMSPIPSQLSSFMEVNAGGINVFAKLETMLANDAGDLVGALQQLMGGLPVALPHPPHTPAARFLEMLTAGLNIERRVGEPVRGLVSLRGVMGAELFLPLDRANPMIRRLAAAIMSLDPYTHGSTSFYLEGISRHLFTMNDLGMPVLLEMNQPTVLALGGKLHRPNGHEEHTYSLGGYFSTLTVAAEMVSSLTVPMPNALWMVAAGVSVNKAVSLPLEVKAMVRARPDRPSSLDQLALSVGSAAAGRRVVVYQAVTLPWNYAKMSVRGSYGAFRRRLIRVSETADPLVYENQKMTQYVTRTRETDVTSVRESTDHSTLWNSLLGSGKFLYHLVESDVSSCRYSAEEIALNLPTDSDFVSVKLNISTATLEAAGSHSSGSCGQSGGFTQQTTGEEGAFPQQTTGQHTEDMGLQGSQEEDYYDDFGSFGSQQQTPAKLVEEVDAEESSTYGFGDMATPQLQHYLSVLRRDAHWNGEVHGYSVRLDFMSWNESTALVNTWNNIDIKPTNAEASMHYPLEVVLAYTRWCDHSNHTEYRASLGVNVFDQSPLQMCEDLKVLTPKSDDVDSLLACDLLKGEPREQCLVEGLTAQASKRTVSSKVFTGQRCSHLLGTNTDERYFSEGWLNRTLTEALRDLECPDTPRDEVAAFFERAIYDKHRQHVKGFTELEKYPVAKYLSDINKVLAKQFYSVDLDQILQDCARGDPEVEKSDEFVISSTRVGEQLWRIHHTLPSDERGREHTVRLQSPLLEMVNRPAIYTPARPDRCVVGGGKVRTFDGLTVNASLSAGCPVLLATSCDPRETQPFAVAVKTGPGGRPTVFVTSVGARAVITVTPNRVKINEKEVDLALPYYEAPLGEPGSPDSRLAARVYRRRGFMKVELPGLGHVIVNRFTAYVHVEDGFSGALCGLCGNMDSEPSNDLVCPKNCALSDSENFSKAWTINYGFECSPGFESSEECHRNSDWSPDHYSKPSLEPLPPQHFPGVYLNTPAVH